MKVLSRKEYADIIAWTPSGKAFNVINRKEFTARSSRLTSRAPNIFIYTEIARWGFKTLAKVRRALTTTNIFRRTS
jgi:hypothetical protein